MAAVLNCDISFAIQLEIWDFQCRNQYKVFRDVTPLLFGWLDVHQRFLGTCCIRSSERW
jgi:hypothetical protein